MPESFRRTVPPPVKLSGRVTGSNGPLLHAQIPLTSLGAEVVLHTIHGMPVRGIVTALRENQVTIAPLSAITGVMIGTVVHSSGQPLTVALPRIASCTIDALGNDIDPAFRNGTTKLLSRTLRLNRLPPSPLLRIPIDQQLYTEISAIDAFIPLGYGQRLSLSAPAGAGKSTLLSMIIRNAAVDHTVIALIGERGREVRDFVDATGGNHAAKNHTLVVSTSDEPPIRRVLAAETAFSIAEELRSQGKRVLLIVDSLTRLARSMRDIGLANGELPVRQGYPASVLVELPRLLERAGNDQHGSITSILSLLQDEPAGTDFLTHEVTSLLDGHIVLDSGLVQQGHYPAIDITRSLSRLTPRLLTKPEQSAQTEIIKVVNRLYRDRDLLLLGGTPDAELAHAIAHEKEINQVLVQAIDECRPADVTQRLVRQLAAKLKTVKIS